MLAVGQKTKTCGSCGCILPVTDFWKNAAKPDGLQNQCKGCLKLRQKKYRATPEGKEQQRQQNACAASRASRRRYAQTQRGKETARKAQLKHTAAIRKEARQLVRDLKDATPCADCGQSFHFSAMDFDHVRGEKKDNIATMVTKTYSLATLRKELAKCEVVCANCHRVRTYLRKTGKETI